MRAFEEDLLPTPEEIAFYERNGWLLTNLFVSEEALDACREAIEEVYAGKYDRVHSWSSDPGNAGFNVPYQDRSKQRMDAFLSLHKNAIGRVVKSPALAAYAAALMKTKRVRLYRDILLTMPGATEMKSGTNWHVDKNYWPTCSSEQIISAWFSLEDCDEENGCLIFASESHRWPRSRFVQKIDLENHERLKQLSGGETLRLVTVPHRRGQISFHSCLTLHASHPNVSSRPRQSFAVVLQDEKNHYVKEGLTEGRAAFNFNTNDRIGPKDAAGHPDYHDPEFYPVLFDAEYAAELSPKEPR
jgi:ectoine hydroxylase-related dioxygenase (phytanoyl-CoA dioxygenase family)